jgi:putative phosphoribosyl transferase
MDMLLGKRRVDDVPVSMVAQAMAQAMRGHGISGSMERGMFERWRHSNESMFADRRDAGRRLATRLEDYQRTRCPAVIVVGLPRGGVPVAYEIAQALDCPLEMVVVRKLGAPGQPELAIGALASGNVRVLNKRLIAHLGLPPEAVDEATEREQQRLTEQEQELRGDLPPIPLANRVVILVDDGLATGATMRVAIARVRDDRPARIVLATPLAAPEILDAFRPLVDDIVAVLEPARLQAVGNWYEDFAPTPDAQVRDLLRRRREEEPGEVEV